MNAAQLESLAVDRACRRLGVEPMATRRQGEDRQVWRATALAIIGVRPPSGKISHTDILQRAGRISGHLYENITHDDSGRKLKKFYGSPEACWGQFRAPTMKLRRFIKNTDDRGQRLTAVYDLNGIARRVEYSDGRRL